MILEKTKEQILQSMLNSVPEEYDKSEGGLFYDNLAPVSIEMESELKKLSYVFKNSFAETAEGEFLTYIAQEVGLDRGQATKATGYVSISGNPGAKIEIGIQVASDTYIYKVLEEATIPAKGSIEVKVEAEEAGSGYNVPAGAVDNFPVTIQGLQGVTNVDPIEGGYDEETDDELRERYFFKVRNPITSGNVFHYIKWCKEVEGVGGVKVFPLHNGPGTVKCVIADKSIEVAPEELLEKVRAYIETVRPIGADVTISSAESKEISIKATVVVDPNVNFEEVQTNYTAAANKYLKEVGFFKNYVSYARLGSLLLKIPGVVDYTNLLINGGTTNVELAKIEVPKLVSVDLTQGKE